jgi:lipooligosaccharide transport system ATP-binding protein
LADRADTPADELSGGMRRRLLIARGTLHQPQLVLLDEPTVGLDPQIRSQLWSQIETLRDRGVTTLLSTHYMEEAERLCDLVAVMHHGRLIAYDRPARLIADHVGKRVLEVTARAPRLADVERWARSVGLPTRRSGSTLVVMGVDGVAAPDALAADGQLRDATLEDVFVVLTGAELT